MTRVRWVLDVVGRAARQGFGALRRAVPRRDDRWPPAARGGRSLDHEAEARPARVVITPPPLPGRWPSSSPPLTSPPVPAPTGAVPTRAEPNYAAPTDEEHAVPAHAVPIRLVLETPDGARVPVPDAVVVGRLPGPGRTIALPDPGRVLSRAHAAVGLEADGRAAWVQDLDSANGTAVGRGGELVPAWPGRRVRLADGDVLHLADHRVRVRITPPR